MVRWHSIRCSHILIRPGRRRHFSDDNRYKIEPRDVRISPLVIRLCAVIFMAAAGLSSGATPASEHSSETLESVRAQRGAVEQARIETQKLERTRVVELRDLETALATSRQRVRHLDQDLKQQRNALARLKGQRNRHLQGIERQKSRLEKLLRALYLQGPPSTLRLLLRQDDLNHIGRMRSYSDLYQDALRGEIKRIRGEIDKLAGLEAALNTSQTEMQRLRQQQDAEMNHLHRQRRARVALVMQIRQELSTQDAVLRELRAQERALATVVTRLQSQAAGTAIPAITRHFAAHKGHLPWPVIGRTVTESATRRGVRVLAARGSEVRAVAAGRVVYADWLRGYGLLLILDHGAGYMSLYAHNETLYHRAGTTVMQGERIAQVGDSGGQDTTSLYFELRHNAKPLAARNWLRPAAGPASQ